MRRCPKLTTNQKNEIQFEVKKSKDPDQIKRLQTVLLVDQEADVATIEMLTGYKRSRAFVLRKLYQEKGIEAAKGKEKKGKTLLSKTQLTDLVDFVKQDKSATKAGYSDEWWSTSRLADYIWKTYHVRYKSKTSYYLIFKEARFTFHKPGKVYRNHNHVTVDKWKEETTELLKDAWNDSNIVILCEDELILSTQTTFQKIWLPANEYPVVEINNKREIRGVYGFYNVKTGKEHAFKTTKINMFETKKVLQKIRSIYPKTTNKGTKVKGVKIILIWDNAGWHKGHEPQEYIKKDGNITQIYLPAYAPEENPQEHVWKDGRSNVTHNKFIENIDKSTDEFTSYLNSKLFSYSLLGRKS